MTDIIRYYGKREGNVPLADKLAGHRDTTNSRAQTAQLQQHTEAAIHSMREADLKAGKNRMSMEDFEAHGDPAPEILSTSRRCCRENKTWKRKTQEPGLFSSESTYIDDETGAAGESELTGVFRCPRAPPPLPALEALESRESMEANDYLPALKHIEPVAGRFQLESS